MGFWGLFVVAAMPVVQVLIVTLLGAYMASDYGNLLLPDARKSINKIVFAVFTPSLMFASLAKSVTFQDIISWWFMPFNVGIIFFIGAMVGRVLAKVLQPEPYMEGLVVACCSAGNFGNLLLIVIPSICDQEGSPFGESSVCHVHALSYASFSMALGGIFTWTYTYSLFRNAATLYHQTQLVDETAAKTPNRESDVGGGTRLLATTEEGRSHDSITVTIQSAESSETGRENLPIAKPSSEENPSRDVMPFIEKLRGILHQFFNQVKEPPQIAMIFGFLFGSTPWLNSLIIGSNAPFRVVQDSVKLLGDGTLPCITLILGGNLYQGLRAGKLKVELIIAVIIVRYLVLPVVGIILVKAANDLGFLAHDPLYRYVLMIQFTIPPAMNIGTMTQLLDIGQDECSVILLWTYLVAAFAITIWSTIFMWIL